jgi:cytochrome c551/c552
MFKRILRIIFILLGVGIVIFLLIQLVPYGKDHNNPPVVSEPNWDSQQTRDLAKKACFDCHSNETIWPWYSNVAPVSWLVYRDVVEGRQRFNFSEWQSSYINDAGEFAEVINEGEMPPFQYLPMHPSAKLSSTEKTQLINGLSNTLNR